MVMVAIVKSLVSYVSETNVEVRTDGELVSRNPNGPIGQQDSS